MAFPFPSLPLLLQFVKGSNGNINMLDRCSAGVWKDQGFFLRQVTKERL